MWTSLTVPSGSPTRAACRYISNFYFEDKKFTKMHREYQEVGVKNNYHADCHEYTVQCAQLSELFGS